MIVTGCGNSNSRFLRPAPLGLLKMIGISNLSLKRNCSLPCSCQAFHHCLVAHFTGAYCCPSTYQSSRGPGSKSAIVYRTELSATTVATDGPQSDTDTVRSGISVARADGDLFAPVAQIIDALSHLQVDEETDDCNALERSSSHFYRYPPMCCVKRAGLVDGKTPEMSDERSSDENCDGKLGLNIFRIERKSPACGVLHSPEVLFR